MGVRKLSDGAQARFEVQTHTGVPVQEVTSCWLDEQGRLYLDTDRGLGVVRSMDMDAAADAVAEGVWSPQDVAFADLPGRFHYALNPRPPGTQGA
jgi:hypothetical protein